MQLHCAVIKNKRMPTVRIVKPESIVAVGINRPMEHAVYDACANMIDWLSEDYGIKPQDTYIRMSCDPAFRIRTYQMVRAITIEHCRRRGISQAPAGSGLLARTLDRVASRRCADASLTNIESEGKEQWISD